MPLTVVAIEADILSRVKGKMAYVSMNITSDTPNPDLAGPIRRAARFVGIEPANPLAVADDDVASLVGWQAEQLSDAATLQTLKSIQGQLAEFDVKVGNDAEMYSQVSAQVAAQIAALETALSKPYGPAMPTLSGGQMSGRFIPNDPLAPCEGGHPWRAYPCP